MLCVFNLRMTVMVTGVEETMQICKKASHLHGCPTEHMMFFLLCD